MCITHTVYIYIYIYICMNSTRNPKQVIENITDIYTTCVCIYIYIYIYIYSYYIHICIDK